MAELLAIKPSDQPAILTLNNAHARETSWLEPAGLGRLLGQAYLSLRVGEADAFLLAFDQHADYSSPNYLWFKHRYPRFAYVDRIIVAGHARGRGLARELYDALFSKAKSDGHDMVACEVNSDPPNPGSDAFHAAMGFQQVGTASIYDGERTVSYLVRQL